MTYRLALPLLGLLLGIGAWLLIPLDVRIADEGYHLYQIQLLMSDAPRLDASITMIPGYHVLMTLVASLLEINSDQALRLVSLGFSVTLIPCAFLLAKHHLQPSEAWMRTLQVALLPILTPLLFLAYTDLLAACFVMLAFWCVLRHQGVWAIGLFAFAILFRQTNIVWAAMGILMMLSLWFVYHEPRLKFSQILIGGACLAGAWLLFVMVNQGVSLGDRDQQALSINLSNVYFCLLLFFLIFLPLNLSHLKRFLTHSRPNLKLLIWTLVGFVIFWFTYEIRHPYNGPFHDFFLRNQLLIATTQISVLKIAAFLAICTSIITLSSIRLESYRWYLLYPFSILSVLPMPLIEQRYYLVPYLIFLLVRKSETPFVERTLLVYFIGVSSFLLFGISQQRFFL